MTGQIIPLHADEHREVQLLLPWYATERLEAADHARVEAHLGSCAECQADLALERRMAVAVAALPTGTPPGWDQLKQRLPRAVRSRAPRAPAWTLPTAWFDSWRPGAQTLGWTAALQFVLLLALGSLLVLRPAQPVQSPASYRALGSAPAPAAANLIVIFQPDTPEKALRTILNASHARLVDGPTVADAYVLHVAPGQRNTELARLRARPEVLLAEPVDGDGKN